MEPSFLQQLAVGLDGWEGVPLVRNELFVKPKGGLWTSTFLPEGKYASGWVEWCHGEMPGWIRGGKALLLKVYSWAKVYVIDSYADLERLVGRYPYRGGSLYDLTLIDWETALKDYDGVNMTDRGQWATRLSRPLNLYSWDCESTLWFRDMFSEKTPYEGKLVR